MRSFFVCGRSFRVSGGAIAAGRSFRHRLYDEWRFHVRLDLFELGNHLPVLRRRRKLPVDEVLSALRVQIAHFPEVMLFVETSIDFLELKFFLQFLQFFFKLLDLLGLGFLVAFEVGALGQIEFRQ